jgi:nucleoside diphosphate kinase
LETEKGEVKKMEQAMSYVLVTPYTVAKSRTGGVLARLLSQVDLELVGAQMIAPDKALVRDYAASLREENQPGGAPLLADYVEQNLAPSGEIRHRTLLLLFRGENPCEKLTAICGHIYPEHLDLDAVAGETIRDTYADLIRAADNPNTVIFFEPAVLTPRTQDWADKDLALFARFLKGQENIIRIMPPKSPPLEQTLVIIKPDNWQYASSKPGTIIDMFSRTGLRIVGIKVHRFSLAEALEFYGPVEGALRDKLSPVFGKKARELLEREFTIQLSDALEKTLSDSFGTAYAEDQFAQIIEFMSGFRPEKCPPDEAGSPGIVKCMILIYEGEDAVRKIREVLGPTDPLKAPGGTIRREFGRNVMVNTAHASDSPESMEREKKIVKIDKNPLEDVINLYLSLKR